MNRYCLLAFAVLASATALGQTYRSDRPIRGVWLRPPSTISSLETSLQAYARAGITDLYLETFYHGLSTGKQGIFNSRFGYDYLGQAIPLAARYNIRVHAWVEAGYWQYQTTGAYNFTSNPEWQVKSIATGATGGDQAGQVFANLCHPGVQAKLRAYCTELAGYSGLWGIQTDYHRMPIDDVTNDVYSAPWSYESWSNAQFMAIYGAGADIFTQADRSTKPYWNQFLNWRRAGISEAARQMYLGIKDGSDDIPFEGAIFASAMSSSAQIAKCQDWPSWCSGGYLDMPTPMAYGSLSGITSDLNTAKSSAAGKRVVAGLAITSGHPALTDQLDKTRDAGVGDFILWEGNQITASIEPTLLAWLQNTTNAKPMRADLNDNRVLDVADYLQFLTGYSGTAVGGQSAARANMDADTDIDSNDHKLFREAIAGYRIGHYGKLSNGDRTQLNLARTAAPAGGGATVKNVYDFDNDGDVDDMDSRWMEKFGAAGPFAFISVSLQGSSIGLGSRDVQLEWRTTGNVPITTWNDRPVLNSGLIVIPTPGAGNYKLSLKYSHWLRRTINVTVGSTDVANVILSMVNGDVNGDNFIDLFDYLAFSGAYDASTGDPTWLANADFNEDGTIDFFDYLILSGNYETDGDI
ncbi:MAG: family 10 glycosylhydrolase [Chthonomonas sp.]|nr:family 10 glycosylhydrolase [Chthonomonas sp.]